MLETVERCGDAGQQIVRQELRAAGRQGVAPGAGVQTVEPHDVLTRSGDVLEEAVEELRHRQGHRALRRAAAVLTGLAVIGVTEGDALPVVGDQAVILDRAAAHGAGEVGGDAAAVGVALADADVPLLPGGLAEQGERRGEIEVGRQTERSPAQELLDGAEELASIDDPHDGEREEVSLARRLPDALGRQAAAGGQAVDVGVEHERAAPGVQRCDHTRPCPEMALVGEELEERATGALEEDAGHRPGIPLPEDAQLGGQGEDDVVVIAGQDLPLLLFQPLLDLKVGALGAGAVAAGVVPDLGMVPFGADFGMAAEGGRATAQEIPNGSLLVCREAMGFEEVCEPGLKHGLERRPHIRGRRNPPPSTVQRRLLGRWMQRTPSPRIGEALR